MPTVMRTHRDLFSLIVFDDAQFNTLIIYDTTFLDKIFLYAAAFTILYSW